MYNQINLRNVDILLQIEQAELNFSYLLFDIGHKLVAAIRAIAIDNHARARARIATGRANTARQESTTGTAHDLSIS